MVANDDSSSKRLNENLIHSPTSVPRKKQKKILTTPTANTARMSQRTHLSLSLDATPSTSKCSSTKSPKMLLKG